MSRLTGKGAGSLADAYASIYEGYGKKKEEKKGEDCTAASEKTTHNCAKKVCHEQFGEGTCVHGQHSFPDENGFVSHYDVQFSHGIEKAVPVSEMKVLEEGSHNEEAHEGMYDGNEVLREFEDTDSQLDSYYARKKKEAEAAKAKIDAGQSVKARTGLIGTDTLTKSGTTKDGRAILDVKRGGGIQLAAPDRSTVIGNQRYDRLTTRDKEGNTRYQYVQAADKQGQVANKNVAAGSVTKPVTPPKKTVTPPPRPRPKPQPAKPALNKDQQAVNTEYDRLRKSGDMAAAAAYGKRMAAAGASRSDFKMPTTNTPAPAQKPSVSSQVSDLQAMRKASQERQAAAAAKQKLNQDVDLFDLVKGHLIDEGASEEEAMKKMVSMTQEEILALAEGYDEPKMHDAVKRVMTTQPAAKGRAASRLHTKYSMRSKGLTAGETDGPGPNAPKRSGRKGRGSETDRGSGNAAKRRMDK